MKKKEKRYHETVGKKVASKGGDCMVTGKVIKGVVCLVYKYNNRYYAIAMDGTGLVATW